MKISYNGKGVYLNKTVMYLVPMLAENPGLSSLLNIGFLKLAIGIDDYLYNKKKGRFLFFMVHSKFRPSLFEKSLQKLRLMESYVDDYSVDENEHMLVVKICEGFEESYDAFLKGSYSKMYTKDFVNKVFTKKKRDHCRNVLLKNEEGKWEFFEHLREHWGIKDPHTIDVKEYEEPPKYKEEIFNYPEVEPIYLKIDE